MRNYLWIGLVLGLSACYRPSQSFEAESTPSLPEVVDFNFHIRPILSDRCFACHGPDENKREAQLRLDTEEGALHALLEDGELAIVPGKPEESALIHRITHTDPEERMPPPSSNLSLSSREIALLEKWIEQGAEWKNHWAFEAPQWPEVPAIPHTNWPVNVIDTFIFARLQREGMAPNPQASKAKQLRRLSFDLRGLPPTLEELDAFLQDPDPAAYEKWVDQYLSDPALGERLATEWMDLARYADSHGYQDDLERSMWPWRDWVIQAFNDNLPYDTFLVWQLAGDLLPQPTYEQQLATAFNRNHKITQEVGVIDEEYRVEYVVDRTNTFSSAFLGLTLECARCHDHKYDPFSQKEYFQLFSFFNQVPEKGRVDYGVEVADPTLPLPQELVDAHMQSIQRLIRQQEQDLSTYLRQQQAGHDLPAAAISARLSTVPFPEGQDWYFPLDYLVDSFVLGGENPGDRGKISGGPVPVPGKFSGGLAFNGENEVDLGFRRGMNWQRPFSVSMYVRSPDAGARGTLLAQSADRSGQNRGIEWYITNPKRVAVRLTHSADSDISVESLEPFPGDRWVHLVLTYDGSGRAEGIHLYRDGKPEQVIVNRDNLRGDFAYRGPVTLGKRPGSKGFFTGQIDEVRFFQRELPPTEVAPLYHWDPMQGLDLQQEAGLRRQMLHELHHRDSAFIAMTQQLLEARIREVRLQDVILKPTMVMRDGDSLRPTFILQRGQYDAPGERVEAGIPEKLLPFAPDLPPNRLGLAQWLTDPEHPLTARVAVNRYWQMIFGTGLVATPGDFGSQGALPTHPELLDYLALRFVGSGWDLKALIKLMVMSATYRQDVRVSEDLYRRDPDNLLLARGPQQRLPAEMVRDHALSVSGLLVKQIGGPSVKPYQPQGLWLATASGNQPLRKYYQDHGDPLYRRSLYTFWKRTIPPPSMLIFDAATRNQCTLQRQETSTPLQALVLLNDPQFVEAARQLAVRMIREGGDTFSGRATLAFRLATSRAPRQAELELLEGLLREEVSAFEAAPKAAEALIRTGEYPPPPEIAPVTLAAYTQIALAILNLTESINKA